MALASVDDVLRILRSDSAEDADAIEPVLEAVSEWVSTVYDGLWDAIPNQTLVRKYYNVNPDQFLKLPDPNPSNVSILVQPGPYGYMDNMFTLQEALFQVTDDGNVQLQVYGYVSVPGIDYVAEHAIMPIFQWVQVTWTASGIVPAPVREAVALITAATYSQQENDVSGVMRERIGNYSYEVDPKSGLFIPPRARAFLRPFTRKRRVRTI